MSQLQINEKELIPSESLQLPASVNSKPFIQQKIDSDSKSRKWTQEEHILYILFLEFNRNKIKSKLIRRSNSFYKQMADFIKGKNGIQCRSHHQKYQARYKYPHKIIREEKEKLDQQLYNSIKQTLVSGASPLNSPTITDNEVKPSVIKIQKDYSNLKSVSCQTQIKGIDQVLLRPEQLDDYYNWLNQVQAFHHARQAQLMYNWPMPTVHYPMSNLFLNRPF